MQSLARLVEAAGMDEVFDLALTAFGLLCIAAPVASRRLVNRLRRFFYAALPAKNKNAPQSGAFPFVGGGGRYGRGL